MQEEFKSQAMVLDAAIKQVVKWKKAYYQLSTMQSRLTGNIEKIMDKEDPLKKLEQSLLHSEFGDEII